MNSNTKAVLQKAVDTANANALKAYETQVNSYLEAIKSRRADIKSVTERFETEVAYHAGQIANTKESLDALQPPAALTGADIFGADIVDSAS